MSRNGLAGLLSRTASEQRSRIESLLRSGRLSVFERPRTLSRHSHDYIDAEPDAPAPPAPAPEPIIDAQLALMISRCHPEYAQEPLKFTYLLRGLEGRPVSLTIVSDSFPRRVVHERPLSPGETSDGPHDTEWDGIITQPGAHQGERLSSSTTKSSRAYWPALRRICNACVMI
ncbi:hypothetical protein [Enhygromyxa salina]|uniref:Uncharacterized protein n=1 Tax=Enhygromyxa salina TaxID=215803 RepID=A0A2S9YSM9_9BACT|nr:hypothetical protein [Enhygromyxa salina]PRQ08093.1 hypothetical protein ENSA7_22470 [Enhygromyxa salina]